MNVLNRLRVLNQVFNSQRIHVLNCYPSISCVSSINKNYSTTITNPKISAKDHDESKLFSGFIPMEKIEVTFSRSTGAGGQNVNKVNTKVDLRFHVASAEWLSDEVKEKLLNECKTKINKEGFLIIKSDVTRYQQLNVADALEKLRSLIREIQKPPTTLSEETLERIRRKQEKAARERLLVKRQVSQTKKDRQAPTVNL